MTFLNPIWLFALLLLSVLLVHSTAAAQEKSDPDTAEKKKPEVEMLECKVKVVDPDGFPVEEATVFCSGLRSKEVSSTGWGWSNEAFGKAPRIKTNADGIAIMPYPEMIAEGHTTAKLTWRVEHPDFVNYRQEHSVEDDPAELKLENGFRIALMATNATGDRVKENLHAVTSFEEGGKWELTKNGMFVSGVMKKQKGIMRVACFQDGKPTLFSKEIKIDPADKSRVLLKDIKLSPGSRIKGKLDESVERPVQNGYVIANLAKRPTDSTGWNSLRWSDEAKISEDGTFVFESLPGDDAIQMIPICDGFVTAKPTAEEVLEVIPDLDPQRVSGLIRGFKAIPQIVKTEGREVTKTLKMTKAASVTVKVVDQNGAPVPGVQVATSPNQHWFNLGSQILGGSSPTRKIWEVQKSGVDLMTYYESKMHPYSLSTDKNGVVTFKTMPLGQLDIGVYDQEWEMRKNPLSGERSKRIRVRDSDRTVTIKIFPKGSLSRSEDDASEQPSGETLMGDGKELTEQAK